MKDPSKPLYVTTEQTNINCATIIFKQLDDAVLAAAHQAHRAGHRDRTEPVTSILYFSVSGKPNGAAVKVCLDHRQQFGLNGDAALFSAFAFEADDRGTIVGGADVAHIGLAEFVGAQAGQQPGEDDGEINVRPNRFGDSSPGLARRCPATLRRRCGGGPWGHVCAGVLGSGPALWVLTMYESVTNGVDVDETDHRRISHRSFLPSSLQIHDTMRWAAGMTHL